MLKQLLTVLALAAVLACNPALEAKGRGGSGGGRGGNGGGHGGRGGNGGKGGHSGGGKAGPSKSGPSAAPATGPNSAACKIAKTNRNWSCAGAAVSIGWCGLSRNPGACAGAAIATGKCIHSAVQAHNYCRPSRAVLKHADCRVRPSDLRYHFRHHRRAK